MNKPSLLNYSRISTTKQSTGSGLAQQQDIEVMSQLSHKYSLEIDSRTFSDVGKSAYKGTHLENDLGRLIALIEDGSIASGSIIVMFSLDRLSRQHLTSAVSLLLSIISKGVGIHTTIDNRLYTNDSDSLMADLMMSLIAFAVANEESVKKSARTRGNALKLITEHQEGKRSPDGYAYAIKSVGSHPWFIDATDGTVKPDVTYFPIAQEILSLLTDGLSPMEVKAILDNKYEAKNTSVWRVDLIRKLHNADSLTGDRPILINGIQYILKDYYPKLITDVQLHTLRKLRESRSIAPTASTRVKLIGGMSKLVCACCGGTGGSAVNTKGVVSYFCKDARKKQAINGCTGWTVKADYLEQAVLNICTDVIGAQVTAVDNTQELAAIEYEIETKTTKLSQLNEQVLAGATLPTVLINSMVQLEADITKLTDKLTALKAVTEVDIDSLAEQWSHIRTLPEWSDNDARNELKGLIRRSIDIVTITKNEAYSDFTITIKLINGHERSVRCIKGKLGITEVSSIPTGYIGGYELEGELSEVFEGKTDVDMNSPLFK